MRRNLTYGNSVVLLSTSIHILTVLGCTSTPLAKSEKIHPLAELDLRGKVKTCSIKNYTAGHHNKSMSFNEQGYILDELITGGDGNVRSYTKFEYSENMMSRMGFVEYRMNGYPQLDTTLVEFDSLGAKIYSKLSATDNWMWIKEYDKSHRLIKEGKISTPEATELMKEYNDSIEDRRNHFPYSNWTEYEYDHEGRESIRREIENEELRKTVTISYSSKRNRTLSHYLNEDSLVHISKETLDPNGLILKLETYRMSTPEQISVTEYSYDDHNQITKNERVSASGIQSTIESTYEYDDVGNWIRREVVNSNQGTAKITTRQIEYFE